MQPPTLSDRIQPAKLVPVMHPPPPPHQISPLKSPAVHPYASSPHNHRNHQAKKHPMDATHVLSLHWSATSRSQYCRMDDPMLHSRIYPMSFLALHTLGHHLKLYRARRANLVHNHMRGCLQRAHVHMLVFLHCSSRGCAALRTVLAWEGSYLCSLRTSSAERLALRWAQSAALTTSFALAQSSFLASSCLPDLQSCWMQSPALRARNGGLHSRPSIRQVSLLAGRFLAWHRKEPARKKSINSSHNLKSSFMRPAISC